MVRLGWMSDQHVTPDGDSTVPDISTKLSTAITSLVDTYSVSDIYSVGDQVVTGDNRGNVPHVTQTHWDKFFEIHDSTGYYDRFNAFFPGNHDVPLGLFLEQRPECMLRGQWRYDGDGVTVLGLNTAASAQVTGSPGPKGGIGVNRGWVPYSDVKWLDRQLADAPSSDTKIVFFHHLPYENPGVYNSSNDQSGRLRNGTFHNENAYDICLNYDQIHSVLQKYSRVVAPHGHAYQFSNEGFNQFNGVYYVYKQHYNDHSGNVTNYHYIDATSTSISITSVDQSAGTTTKILDVTW